MMKIFKPLIFFLITYMSLFSIHVLAKVVTVEISASGLTKDIAIEKALTRAISQVRGIDIDSRSLRQMNQIKVNGKSSSIIALAHVTAMTTKGQIKSYSIIDENCSQQSCDLTLSVVVPVYKSPGLSPNNRRKLVVAPFTGINGKKFANNLQAMLVQSRRFAVLDREHQAQYNKEKSLLLSANTTLDEKVRLGQVLGLDYLIIGEVSTQDNSSTKVVELTGEKEFIVDVQNQISYKVINLATRQIKWQDQTSIEGDLTALPIASAVASSITSAIYPIKIIAANPKHIILNQGGRNIQLNAIFDVFSLGDKLIDPYTKESLGREEIFVGQIKITKVTTKSSYASVISGLSKEMKKGSIVRVARNNTSNGFQDVTQTHVKSTVTPSASGGIILPLPPKKEALKTSPKGGVVIEQ